MQLTLSVMMLPSTLCRHGVSMALLCRALFEVPASAHENLKSNSTNFSPYLRYRELVLWNSDLKL